MHAKSLQSCPTLCDLMDCSSAGSLSMGFPKQEYWNGLPFPSPGDFPDSGMEPASSMSPALQADSSQLNHGGSPCGKWACVNLLVLLVIYYIKCLSITSKWECCCHLQGFNSYFHDNTDPSIMLLFIWLFSLVRWFFKSFDPFSVQMVTAAMKLIDAYSLEGKLWPT